MSGSPEVENNICEDCNGYCPKERFEISSTLKTSLQDMPEVLEYILFLENHIIKQKRKCKKIRAKLKTHRPKKRDACVQVDLLNETNNLEKAKPKSITEEITEAAELATQNSGFVYDESSGLYYDSNTGYYYNAEYGLYYDSRKGHYLSYNDSTKTYKFHSAVHVPHPQSYSTAKETKRKNEKTDEVKAAKSIRLESGSAESAETEEGECSLSSENEDENSSENSDLSKQWPPCMRIIVEQSKLPKIKIGSLHILTFEGGTLGREGDHAILIPDINVSKCHLKFTYSPEQNLYFVADLGSRNGTILNGKRMSASKQESGTLPVPHGSRIQVGAVVLLCHVHDGTKTCGLCEPGLIQTAEEKVVVAAPTKSEQHKHELKKLKKKFGVTGFEEGNTKLAAGYTDRAQKRRDTVGSQNPHEKTEVASLQESISSQNKGFKMLAKMGWKEGQSLGKDNQGLLEPVPIVGNAGTSGMGSGEPSNLPPPDFAYDRNKQIVWKKTQERFQKVGVGPGIFGEDSD